MSDAAFTIPPGWKLVPITATDGMVRAAGQAEDRHYEEGGVGYGGGTWQGSPSRVLKKIIEAAIAEAPEYQAHD